VSGALVIGDPRVSPTRRASGRASSSAWTRQTLERYPRIALDGPALYAESPWISQLKTLPVRLSPR
jgi:hypothetical protein